MAALVAATDIISLNALCLFLLGALGALIRDITDDGGLTLPSLEKGNFYLGFAGGMIIGGVAGLISGDGFISALTAGFTGYAIILAALGGPKIAAETKKETPQETITRIAKKNKTDEKLALAVAEAESSFNATAIHTNADGSRDRGLFQINSKYHPQVTDEQAFNAEFSAQFFCDAVKAGNLSWWNASKPKWIEKVYA